MKNSRVFINKIYFSGLLIIPLVLLFLPADFFDHSTIDTCLSVIIFDRNCPACGMTRAFQHLIHLDFAAAAHFNKLSFIVFPIITFVWILELRKAFRYIKAHKSK